MVVAVASTHVLEVRGGTPWAARGGPVVSPVLQLGHPDQLMVHNQWRAR